MPPTLSQQVGLIVRGNKLDERVIIAHWLARIASRGNEVANVVNHRDKPLFGSLLRGDNQHAVLNEIGQPTLAEHQLQRRPQRHASQPLLYRTIRRNARLLHRIFVQLNLNSMAVLQVVNHIGERRVDKLKIRVGIQRLLDLHIRRAAVVQLSRVRDTQGRRGGRSRMRRALQGGGRTAKAIVKRIHAAGQQIRNGGDVCYRQLRLRQVVRRQRPAGPHDFVAVGQADLPCQFGQGDLRPGRRDDRRGRRAAARARAPRRARPPF